MAKTLLNGVNEVLKRAKLTQESGALSSLTDSPRQVWIDTAVQAWNEVVEELYTATEVARPNEAAESTVTLVTSTRAYSLASDLVQLRWPLQDRTNGQYISHYPGGYEQMIRDQPIPANFTGLPLAAAIRPTDGKLYTDRVPTSAENGLVYTYIYDKDVSMSTAAATMPFPDAVFRALVPAVTEVFNLTHKREFTEELYRMSMGRAARLLTQQQMRSSYGPRSTSHLPGVGTPFERD